MKFNKELQIKWFYLVFPGLITTALWEIGKHLFNAIAVSGNNMINYFANIPYIMAANISADMLLMVFLALYFLLPILAIIFRSIDIRATKFLKKYLSTPNINEDQNKKTARKLKRKKITKLLISCVLISLIFFSFCFYTILSPYMLSLDFKRTVTIISPYVDHATVLKLESDWAKMKTKDDYFAISETLSKIQTEYGIDY